jgi:hypothetical protein
MPTTKGGGAKFRVATDALNNRGRNRRNSLHDKILGGRQIAGGGGLQSARKKEENDESVSGHDVPRNE